ncbi:MAG: HAD family hydrolase [Halobacteriaceae archaeon]
MSYDAVVFDMDGVLVENSPGWVFDRAARTALRAHGVHTTPDAVGRLRDFPRDVPAAEAYFAEQHGVDFDALWGRRERAAAAAQRQAIRRGEKTAYADIGVLPALEADLAVVSNNQHATVETVLGRFGIADHVGAWFGLEPALTGVYRRKPDPLYLERAVDAVGGGTVLYVGDRPSDIAAARYAGVDSAFVDRTGDRGEMGPGSTHTIGTLTAVAGLAPEG